MNLVHLEQIANFAARRVLGRPLLERALVAGCRNATTRRLKIGAVALAYPRVLGRQAERVAQLDGYKVVVNVGEFQGVTVYFFGDPGTIWCTPRLLEPGNVFIDAGANAGIYTFLAASRVGAAGRVIAFEPNPPYAALIRKSIELNGFERRVQLEQLALWDRSDEQMTFYVSNDSTNSGTSSLLNHGVHVSPEKTLQVPTITFDAYAERHGLERCALIKIDVERAEAHVLRGMSRMLSEERVDHLIVEMMGHSEAHDVLERHGYTVFRNDEATRSLRRSCTPGEFGDFIAVSPRKLKQAEETFSTAIRD